MSGRSDFNRALFIVTLCVLSLGSGPLTGCNSNSESIGASTQSRDCLPDLTLTDQDGRQVSLASLKGHPVLFDFIYTTCPGPCLVITSRMKAIADQLGPELGQQVRFVSITVDPEHDKAPTLRAYAKEQGAQRNGWLFLTGSPDAINQVMSRFHLVRQREPDGSVDHVLEFFLVDTHGHAVKQYLASDVNAANVASDLRDAAAGKSVAGA